ncbi:MAG: hypothetical protein IJ223_07390 [Clostridia bacterium]|nr:hypothetical protein [Clostridia bacterium]
MRKALNFDLDTKKYEEFTGKHSPTAYADIKRFLKKNDFEHRQGSGYVSKDSLNDGKIFAIIQNMSVEFKWLRNCVKQIDVTNIGKQHSLIDAVNKAPFEDNLSNLDNIEI